MFGQQTAPMGTQGGPEGTPCTPGALCKKNWSLKGGFKQLRIPWFAKIKCREKENFFGTSSWILMQQVCIHEESRSPARLCLPRQKHYQRTNRETDQRTDTPSWLTTRNDGYCRFKSPFWDGTSKINSFQIFYSHENLDWLHIKPTPWGPGGPTQKKKKENKAERHKWRAPSLQQQTDRPTDQQTDRPTDQQSGL